MSDNDKSTKASFKGGWEMLEDGRLAFCLPKGAHQALIAGEMSLSSTGKTQSPLTLSARPVNVQREDGESVQFKTTIAIYTPATGSDSEASSL